jgi:hypothetical protein
VNPSATFDCQLKKSKSRLSGCKNACVANAVEVFVGWTEEVLMIENINVQYVGFEAKALVREYSFIVRQGLDETSKFTLTIGNEAFASRRVRFQDAPEICSLRLYRGLAVFETILRANLTVSAKQTWMSAKPLTR